MRNKILIRADGGGNIGYGHVYRSLALAQMLKDSFNCCFVSHDQPDFLKKELEKEKIPFLKIPFIDYPSPGQRQQGDEIHFDMEELLTGDEIVVLDGYWFGSAYQHALKNKGCKVVCIDDEATAYFHADIIINHAPNVSPASYNCSADTKLLLGVDYALIREPFLCVAQQNIHKPGNNAIMICFGGSDPLNYTLKITELLLATESSKNIIIVIGNGYAHRESLQHIIKTKSQISLLQNIDSNEMLELMVNTPLGILPASSILFEALACQMRVISGYYISNQKSIYEGFKRLNAFVDAGDFNHNQVVTALSLAKETATTTKKIIDGRSGDRIKHALEELTR